MGKLSFIQILSVVALAASQAYEDDCLYGTKFCGYMGYTFAEDSFSCVDPDEGGAGVCQGTEEVCSCDVSKYAGTDVYAYLLTDTSVLKPELPVDDFELPSFEGISGVAAPKLEFPDLSEFASDKDDAPVSPEEAPASPDVPTPDEAPAMPGVPVSPPFNTPEYYRPDIPYYPPMPEYGGPSYNRPAPEFASFERPGFPANFPYNVPGAFGKPAETTEGPYMFEGKDEDGNNVVIYDDTDEDGNGNYYSYAGTEDRSFPGAAGRGYSNFGPNYYNPPLQYRGPFGF